MMLYVKQLEQLKQFTLLQLKLLQLELELEEDYQIFKLNSIITTKATNQYKLLKTKLLFKKLSEKLFQLLKKFYLIIVKINNYAGSDYKSVNQNL